MSPFEIVCDFEPKQSLDLFLLPSHVRVSNQANIFALHIRNLHKEISNKIKLNNEIANSQKRAKEFLEGDFVMVRLRPEWYSSGTVKKLHARSTGLYKIVKGIGPNVYMLELPSNLGISSTFYVSDLVEYRAPVTIPSEPFEPDLFIESEPTHECPPLNFTCED